MEKRIQEYRAGELVVYLASYVVSYLASYLADY